MGSREESEISGFFVFSHIRMIGYFKLGLEPPTGARNRRKATENTMKTATSNSSLDPFYVFCRLTDKTTKYLLYK